MDYRPHGAVSGATVSRHAPSVRLARQVACYFVLDVASGAEPLHVRALPDACSDVMFDVLAGGAWSSGPRLRPALFTHRGPVRLLGAQLMPGVARLLAGIDLGAMAVELRALDRLPAQLARLDEWLCGALAGRQVEPRVARALAQLMAAGGAVSMEALGRAVGASPRNLQRLFRDWVGLGPKQVGRILRFQAVLACVERRDALDWAAVAHELGYADQSHLIRDAAAFAGLTPSALLSRSS